MKVEIQQEELADRSIVFKLIEKAFQHEKFTDHKEQFLVERLRKSDSFIPELSFVAKIDGKVAGYLLLTKIKIINQHHHAESLALAPLAVLPAFQKQGIGTRLIEQAHSKAKALGFNSIVVLGHENYYLRFGYKQADNFGIQLPFDVPKENCMVIELTKNALKNVQGTVEYAKEFYE